MRAVFYEPGDVRVEDVPVRIGAALTCGTDVKTYGRGHPALNKGFPSPFGRESKTASRPSHSTAARRA